jgi:FkbM family methyltransferase
MPGFRDRVRLRYPRLLNFYQRHVATRLGADGRHFELSDWASEGADLVERLGLHGIRFERDGIWIDDGEGGLWRYTPGLFGSAGGAEFGLAYEQFEIDLLADRLPSGGVFVDVGANIGLFSVQLAKRVDGLTALAFEPVGVTCSALRGNAAKNGVADRVEVRQLALGERPGTLRLTTGFQMANFVVPDDAASAPGSTEEVESRPLDDVLAELGRTPDAIKCDVEGAELDVLRGARGTLERDHPLVLLEIDERWASRYGHSGEQVARFLTERGYGYERIVEDELRPASASLASDLAEGRNFLFTAA